MSINTFQIMQEYLALADLLNEIDEESGEYLNNADDIKEYIENLNHTRNEKLVNIERLKRDMEGQTDTLSAEIKRLQALKKAKENQISKLTDLELTLTNGEKIDAGLFKFSTRKSKSVHVPSEVNSRLENFVRTKYEWDKTAIKKALDSGIDYSEYDIYFEEKVSLSVKLYILI